jgi:S1-C subfamily serine protease
MQPRRIPPLPSITANARRLARQATFVLLGLAHLGFVTALPAADPNVIRKSLARISNTSQEPNYKQPWLPGMTMSSSGTGWVVSKNRILTNAHVVSNARFLTLEKERDPKKYIAEVEHVAHDCDLAILKVQDPAFFTGTIALDLGGIPEIETEVSVYGYPIGGDRLSVTRGVVSRIDFRPYAHSGIDSHLTIQIDAAINPGNSGGPVLQKGKVVGVAFQGFSGDVAQNVGYMIPTPVIRRFLADISDGTYDRYMDLSLTTFNTLNPAMRAGLGLPDNDLGVLVSSVASAGVCNGYVLPGDVILAVDGLPVASDGTVELDNERVQMAEVAERKFRGDSIKMRLLRDRKEIETTIPLSQAWPFAMQANQFDVKPTYVLFGGLLFQPLSRNLLSSVQFQNPRLTYFFEAFVPREIYQEHPEIIVLSNILADPINTYLNEFKEGVVEEINGTLIRTLKDVADSFAKSADFYVVKFIGNGRPLVLERASVEAARERIRTRYGLQREQNLEANAN